MVWGVNYRDRLGPCQRCEITSWSFYRCMWMWNTYLSHLQMKFLNGFPVLQYFWFLIALVVSIIMTDLYRIVCIYGLNSQDFDYS
ncbi:hypothetical protein VNO77_24134 [Canavalia gladiata]|uniref:Uncharacterized protein n=1 Tax=Canavalia gladiata TaxID=3824 RepID=A0AAN9L6Z5_CANGL